MSEANILLAKGFLEDRAQSDLETFLSFLEPDAVMDLSELDRPYSGVYKGREQLESLFQALTAAWRDIHFETSNVLTDGDVVVIDVRRTVQAAGGVGVSSDLTAALRMRGSRISHFKLFEHRVDALRSVGMSA